jgi:hypothetical protein
MKREAVLAAARKIELRKNSARYQRNHYHKARKEYLASPEFEKDNQETYAKLFARLEARKAQREARIVEAEARKLACKAALDAMTPEERHAFYVSELHKNDDFRKARRETREAEAKMRREAKEARREKRKASLRASAEIRARLIAGFEKAAKERAGQQLNTNAPDSTSVSVVQPNEASSPS